MFERFSGHLVKIAFADEVGLILTRGAADRPPARFNRTGEDALYLSRDERSARVAMAKYVAPDDRARVLLRLDVAPCRLLDLRHPDAAAWLARSRGDWKAAHEAGLPPSSWSVADFVRSKDLDGLIDPSRRETGHRHVTLLRWNDGHGPDVRIDGEPEPLSLA